MRHEYLSTRCHYQTTCCTCEVWLRPSWRYCRKMEMLHCLASLQLSDWNSPPETSQPSQSARYILDSRTSRGRDWIKHLVRSHLLRCRQSERGMGIELTYLHGDWLVRCVWMGIIRLMNVPGESALSEICMSSSLFSSQSYQTHIIIYSERTWKTIKLIKSSKVVLKSKDKVGRGMWSVLLSLRWEKKWTELSRNRHTE